MWDPVFRDRQDAGRALAGVLTRWAGSDVIVLGLPRGGVPVGAAIARRLNAPLHAFVVRKLGVPRQPELAFGAIASGGIRVLNDDVIAQAGLSQPTMDAVVRVEEAELRRRERDYHGEHPLPALEGRTVILADDGAATGASMAAAVAAVRSRAPARIIVALPIAPLETIVALERIAEEVVCILRPAMLDGVGSWYRDFHQMTDREVATLLAATRSRGERAAASG